jgi:ribosomal-protein-alanine N-acetyltransferase
MIKTKRLELVKDDVKYASDLFELWNDFEVIKYTYTPLLTTIDECINLIERRISRADKDFTDSFVILLNNKAIGIIGCPSVDKVFFGFYYQLSRKNWGCGYATEAASAVKNYLMNKYPNAIIKAEAVSINPTSIAVLKKIGLKQTHIEEKGFRRNNLELDLIRFSTV